MTANPANSEQRLVLEVQASVQGLPLPSRQYLSVPDLVAGLTNQGSGNWGPMGWSVKYRQGDPAAGPKWAEFFTACRTAFMGDEELSTTYGLWGHLLPIASVHGWAEHLGDAALAAAALEWLRFFFGVYELCRAPDGTILTVGMRSSPWHAPEQASTWLGWVRALARGEDLGFWEALGKKWGLGMGQSFIPPTARAVLPSLAAAAWSAEPLPAFGLMTPLHVMRGDGWLAIWLEQNVNGNTPPLMGALWRDGAVSYLPDVRADSMRRIRQDFDHASCQLTGGVLSYVSSLYGAQSLPLPGGGQEIVLGVGASPRPQPIDPPPVQPPAPGLDLTALVSVVSGLLVPRKQVGYKNTLVDQIRKAQPGDYAALADAVAQLGIGDNEPQAAAWKRVIVALKAAA